MDENTSIVDAYTGLHDLIDPERSYNLIDAYAMKIALLKFDERIESMQKMREKIATQYHRTMKEYMDGDVFESDGVQIVKIKDGRAELDKNKARELYPNEVAKVETKTKHFDEERFKQDNPELYEKYQYETANVTLTDLRKRTELTPEQLEKCINRAPDTYDVQAVE